MIESENDGKPDKSSEQCSEGKEKSSSAEKIDIKQQQAGDSSTDGDVSCDVQWELDSGYRIITEIVKQNKTTCWPFMDAVDAEGLGLWDYHIKIKEPMWINKIINKFENNSYSSFAKIAQDFRVMVENCYRYNTTEHPISKKAKRLEMLFEGKLALLKRSIRESATIAKTSNGRFATLSDEGNPTMRSGRISIPSSGSNREADGESQGRLVYDFIRCEEAALAEDERLASYRERKQQQTLYQQVAAAFVSSLEACENAKAIKNCHSLPEIGLFLHLNETTLKLPALAMYNLEMSLLIPSDSLYLAKIMTSFLCTYYERSLIHQRPPMLFKTWEKRLKLRLEKWYDTVLKYNCYYTAAEKLVIGVNFFHTMNWRNPFFTDDGDERSFLDLTYHEKAFIIKALCDSMTSFQSIQNNIASLPCEQSRAMSLGYDIAGNEYTYFPQFCGDDVRIYRHRQYGDLPEFDPPIPSEILEQQKDKIESKRAKLSPDSLETNNQPSPTSPHNNDDKTVNGESSHQVDVIETKSNSSKSTSIDEDSPSSCTNVEQPSSPRHPSTVEERETDHVSMNHSPHDDAASVNSSIGRASSDVVKMDVVDKDDDKLQRDILRFNSKTACSSAASSAKVINGETSDVKLCADAAEQEITLSNKQINSPKISSSNDAADENTKSKNALENEIKTTDEFSAKENCNKTVDTNVNNLDQSEGADTLSSSDACEKIEIKSVEVPSVLSRSSRRNTVSRSINNYKISSSSFDKHWTPDFSIKKNKNIKRERSDEIMSSPLRRSSRKRTAVNYTSMLTSSEADNPATSEASGTECFSPKKRQKRMKKQAKSPRKTAKIIKVEEPEEDYGSVDFELICDSVDSLRNLIPLIEGEHQEALKAKKPKVVTDNAASLLEKLKWLLGELHSFESHLEKARFEAKIQLKREHDEIYRAATTGKAVQTPNPDVDPWEDELLSKNTLLQSDNNSSYTPPASVYLEESDEDSETELRRSKRKPKRYESDEDFVLEDEDEDPIYHPATNFLYDEFDEDRLRLVPAALEELETRLQKQAIALQKMIGGGRVTRQNDFKDASHLLANERRTRQRSKKENKVFRRVLYMALKGKDDIGPSLLPLLRADQTEIGEVIERVLEKEAIAREQRRLAREEERKQKRLEKQVMQQKKKAAQAAQRAANKLVAKYKNERHDSKSDSAAVVNSSPPIWCPPKKSVLPIIQTSANRNNHVVNETAENVMVRLQNGKICQALRFSDGRVVPIARVDDTSTPGSFNPSLNKRPVHTTSAAHPHISLTGHRNKAAILKRPTPQKNPSSSIPQTSTVYARTVPAVGIPSQPTTSQQSFNNYSKACVDAAQSGTQPRKFIQQQQPVANSPIVKSLFQTSCSPQRLTLPSGQVINLVVKSPATLSPATRRSLGKMFVDDITSNLESRLPASEEVGPSSKDPEVNANAATPPTQASSFSTITASCSTTKTVNKPLGIVSPIQVRQPSVVGSAGTLAQSGTKTFHGPPSGVRMAGASQQPQASVVSTVLAGVGALDTRNVAESPNQHSLPQQFHIGMSNVALVTQQAVPVYQPQSAQPIQLLPTIVAGSVPLVQPLQFVQTIPIQVQAPVMFMAPGQARLITGVEQNHSVATDDAGPSGVSPVSTTEAT